MHTTQAASSPYAHHTGC